MTAVQDDALADEDGDGRLYYTTGHGATGSGRTLHHREDCQHLDGATTRGCHPAHAPRGRTCKDCSPPGLGGLPPSDYTARLEDHQ